MRSGQINDIFLFSKIESCDMDTEEYKKTLERGCSFVRNRAK